MHSIGVNSIRDRIEKAAIVAERNECELSEMLTSWSSVNAGAVWMDLTQCLSGIPLPKSSRKTSPLLPQNGPESPSPLAQNVARQAYPCHICRVSASP
jgi:hypothetical protein